VTTLYKSGNLKFDYHPDQVAKPVPASTGEEFGYMLADTSYALQGTLNPF
jgi:hypothetical protein